MIMWEMASRRTLYEEAEAVVIRILIPDGQREVFDKVDCPPGYADLIIKCWSQNPDDRPEVDEILKEVQRIKASLS